MATKKKQAEARINRIYSRYCDGIAVNIMNLGAIYAAGEKVILAGGTDEEIGEALKAAALASLKGGV